MIEPNRSPTWTRARWIVEAVVVLAIAYPFTGGPGKYLLCRGWISMREWKTVYEPCQDAARAAGLKEAYDAYTQWWGELGYSHHTGTN